MELGLVLFETALGHCGMVWGEQGLKHVQLPEANSVRTRARLLRLFPSAKEAPLPPEARDAIERIIALLRGEPSDLSSIRLDMEGLAPFVRRAYALARKIPPGSTLQYGEIALRLGMPGSARAVGQAMGRNPFAIIVPCHRVVAAGGRSGGFSANGGVATKLRMLAIERACLPPMAADGDQLGLTFDAAAIVPAANSYPQPDE
jgi:methylated-DNA-[protein]-cysteine S-methyltransferase